MSHFLCTQDHSSHTTLPIGIHIIPHTWQSLHHINRNTLDGMLIVSLRCLGRGNSFHRIISPVHGATCCAWQAVLIPGGVGCELLLPRRGRTPRPSASRSVPLTPHPQQLPQPPTPPARIIPRAHMHTHRDHRTRCRSHRTAEGPTGATVAMTASCTSTIRAPPASPPRAPSSSPGSLPSRARPPPRWRRQTCTDQCSHRRRRCP
mmetsp:Transcript_48017/g.125657  ORF Transcript_48017/g.125657 Transcript_48017/m.125657 type:complete len:205 (-) Transcript_48017:1044-1658(-)